MSSIQKQEKIDIPLLMEDIRQSLNRVRAFIRNERIRPDKSVWVDFRRLDKKVVLEFTPDNEVWYTYGDKDKEILMFDGHDDDLPYDAEKIKEKVMSFFQ